MSASNKFIFLFLKIIAWLIFVGLGIEAGGLVVNFFFSVFKPAMVPNLYQKMDLSFLYDSSKAVYYSVYGLLLAVALIKWTLFYHVIMMVSYLDLKKPFSNAVSKHLSRISLYTLLVGLISYAAQITVAQLHQQGYDLAMLHKYWEDGEAFLFMAAILYIITTIFKTGVALQTENDLTV